MNKLPPHQSTVSPNDNDGFFIRKDLTDRWKTTLSKIKRLEKQPDFPRPIRIGRTLLFHKAEVFEYENRKQLQR